MHAQGKSLIAEHGVRRTLPAWMHHFYCRLKDKITVPDISSWRTCPRCFQDFGLHELRGHKPFHVYDPHTPFARPLCPTCCVLAEQSAIHHVCGRCSFRTPSSRDMGRHMVDSHGHPDPTDPQPAFPEAICPACGFDAVSESQLGEHMAKTHHVTRLEIPKFDKVPSAGPKPRHNLDFVDEILVTIHPCDGIVVAARNTDGNTPASREVAKALRAAADRVERADRAPS